jgi:trans-aconitate methyltransferase
MAHQEKVQFVPRVPISWLHDYVSMLRVTMTLKPVGDLTSAMSATVDACDHKIMRRIEEVQTYLDRLDAGPSSIN